MLCSRLKTFKFLAGPRFPTSNVTAQLVLRRWSVFSFRCYADCQQRSNQRLVGLPQTRSSSFYGVEDVFSSGWQEAFQKHSNSWLGRTPPNTAQFFSRCWRTFFVLMLCSHLKTFKFMAGPRSPTSPVTAQLISRRWRIFSFWCYADCQQRSNQRLVVLPQTRYSSFHGVQQSFRLDGMKFFKNIHFYGWALLPQTQPSFCSRCWKTFFVWMLCRHLKLFKFMAGPRYPTSPVTAQLILRRWKVISFWCYADCQQRSNEQFVVLPQTRSSSFYGVENNFSSWWHETFRKHSIWWLGRAPPNTAQLFSRCWRTFSSGCYAHV